MKKIKSFFLRLLGKEKRKSYVPKPDVSFTVRHINSDTDILYLAIGMTEDRAMEIYKVVEQGMKRHSDIASLAEEISPMCTHANELFFMSFVMNDLINKNTIPLIKGKTA